MPLTTQQSSLQSIANVNGSLAVAGLANGLGGQTIASKTQQLSLAAADAAIGGADEVYHSLLSISASGNVTINLQSFTDIAGQATISLARIKGFRIHLLGANDAAPDGTAGNACSSITVGGGASNPNVLNMAGTTPTITINNGSVLHYQDGSASGITVDSSHLNLKIVNNDSGVAAKVLITVIGGTA
jgi:hypothetical protein